MCRLLGISRSSYYDFVSGSAVSASDQQLEQAVLTIFGRHLKRYGSRRIVAELQAQGFVVGRDKVRTILSKYGLKALQPRSFVPKTTQSHPHLRRAPNLLIECGLPTDINQCWVGDITYLPIDPQGFVYMAVWMDLFSRYIVRLADRAAYGGFVGD